MQVNDGICTDVFCRQSLFTFDSIASLPNVQIIDEEELLMIGKTLGYYEITNRLGRGGLGKVYQTVLCL